MNYLAKFISLVSDEKVVKENSLEAKVAEKTNCREEYEGHEVANSDISHVFVRICGSFGNRSY